MLQRKLAGNERGAEPMPITHEFEQVLPFWSG